MKYFKPFTYEYQGRTIRSEFEYYIFFGEQRYRVKSPDGGYFDIFALAFPGPNLETIWVQKVTHIDMEKPIEMIMAMGKGIEQTGYPIHKRTENEEG